MFDELSAGTFSKQNKVKTVKVKEAFCTKLQTPSSQCVFCSGTSNLFVSRCLEFDETPQIPLSVEI